MHDQVINLDFLVNSAALHRAPATQGRLARQRLTTDLIELPVT
jgi:hypothetical protein